MRALLILLVVAVPVRAELTVSAADLPQAEPVRRVDFRMVVEAALGRHLDLPLAALDEVIARRRLETARHGFLPALAAGTGFSHLHGRRQGSFGDLRQVDFDRYDPQLGLDLELNLGARLHALRARQHEYAASRYRYLDVRRRVLLGVSELYQSLRVAQVGTAIARQLVEDRRQMTEVIRLRVEGGTALGSDLAQARAALAEARGQWVAAANEWAQASIRLARVLRWDPGTLLLASGPDPQPDRPVPLSPHRSGNLRPDVEALRQDLAAAGEHTTAAWWQLWGPSLALQWRYTQVGITPGDLDDQEYYRVFLGWRLSLEDWDQIRLRRRERDQTRTRLEQLDDTAHAEIAAAAREIKASRDRVPLARERLKAARDHVMLAMARYRAGKTLLLEVLNAEAALAQARFDLATVISLHHLAHIRYLAAVGELEPEHLLAPVEGRE